MLMEFELDRVQMNGFEAVLDATLHAEETLEMIVPDACPDILRIVETDGEAVLVSKTCQDGRVEVSGTIRASVLYVPDGENGVRHLDVTMPFTCAADGREVGPGCRVVAQARLCRADTRAINPRKVLVRAEAVVDVTVFTSREADICTQVVGASENRVEQLVETQEVYLTASVQEKPFTINERLTLSAGKPAAAEVLKSRVCLCRGESKIIGSRLIFKGSATVNLLYRGEDGGVYSAGMELPFSQILEVMGVSEDADCDLILALTGIRCQLSADGEGRAVDVELEAMVQAVVRENRSLQVLADAYSTCQPLEVEREIRTMDGKQDRGVRGQTVREVWETPSTVREVVDCHLALDQVVQSREGEKLILTAQAELQVLAADVDGGLYALRHTVTVPCPIELPEGCRCLCRCETVGDVYAAPAAGGVEARFGLDFQICALSKKQIAALTGLRPGEAPAETGEQPSLVLRMFEGGERLWDVAKAYGTTIADIISANELEDAGAAAGKLLLIPRRR